MESQPKSVWRALNSRLSLLIIGFLLTTVVGSYLAYRFQREAHQGDLRFSNLHDARVKAIREIYEQTVEVEETLEALYYLYRPEGISPVRVSPEAAAAEVRRFKGSVEKSRIYFGPRLCETLSDLATSFDEAYRSLEVLELQKGPDETPAFEESRFWEFQHEASQARRMLEKQFRELLGASEGDI